MIGHLIKAFGRPRGGQGPKLLLVRKLLAREVALRFGKALALEELALRLLFLYKVHSGL